MSALHPSLRSPGDFEPNWPYYVSLYSEAGFQWAVEYGRPEHVEITDAMLRALGLLRLRRIEPGLELLRSAKAGLREMESTSPVFFNVLNRWYFGAIAYYYYCIEDYDQARTALDQAHEAVQRAIELRAFLAPFAFHCHDFCVQRVRIARNQRRWQEMKLCIEKARQMVMGEQPFCVLSDGTQVSLLTVQAFYNSLAPLTEEEKAPLNSVFDDEIRLRLLRRTVTETYTMSGFVIPYLPPRTAKKEV
jgi:tetratricopeptide (TPR) repeat protein